MAHYQNYLFPMPQHKSFKTHVVTVFCNLVHLSHGTAMGQILCAPPGCSPYKPGGLGFEYRERVVSNLSFTATLSKHKPLIFLEKVGGLWFWASGKCGAGMMLRHVDDYFLQ